MFKREKSIEIQRNRDVQCAHGKVAVQGIGMSVYSFFVDGLLIDTGSHSLSKEFQSFFNEIPIEQLALTHSHEDHAGNAAWIQQHKSVPIYIHRDSVNICAEDGEYPFYRQALWGERQAFMAQPFGDTLQTKSATWDVIETPGHTTDHVSFYNRETGAMFTGDLYIQTKTKVVLDEENIVHTLASLKNILNYDFQEVYCCHAGYIEDGRAKIQEKIAYLEDMEGKIKQLFNKGYSVEEITKTTFPRDYPITKASEEQWSSKHIITAFINHFTQESLK
ncbi:MBL fold metallo-hydrolase [Lysinibacillus agricola]|uniref:MBL fold metallo-hydrolase n=1 Tax=Lysinibacillus agricola TaxID=2590012 RepID=A0ABX7AWK8_9BACI|nr:MULTISPECIES: MBL fold metallo-hydrolase [Lysinibacillus]KOS63471.1 beta-lactamase [Lysinibacillus sp. FJAT-14222]QQP14189.1 MBL fold metallo-hydrolase [Lysinibacillus agricola]